MLSMEQAFYFPALLSPPLMATYCVSALRTDVLEELCQEEGSWIAVASRAELRFLNYFLYVFPYVEKGSDFF